MDFSKVGALDLEHGLPTTEEDVAALRRARAEFLLDLDGYLRFLAQFSGPSVETLRARRGAKAEEPFALRGSKCP